MTRADLHGAGHRHDLRQLARLLRGAGASDEKVAEYVSALEAMYETDAWEAVRSRNGWVNIWNPGDDFRTFLEAQEAGDRRPDAAARLPLSHAMQYRSARRRPGRPTNEIGEGTPWRSIAGSRWFSSRFAAVYGYLAFFTMDQLLPPFMQRNPVWPSTFPKVLSVLGIIVG
jgi:hypothetical protein